MGKRLVSQRRGKGGAPFRAQRKNPKKSEYLPYSQWPETGTLKGEIIRLIKEPGRNSILAKTLFENGNSQTTIAPEGVFVGQKIEAGPGARVRIGNTLPLGNIPEGCPIFDIEAKPGDGGSFVKGSGGYALIVTKDKSKAFIKMPSGKTKPLPLNARATLGCSAGGERTDKPFIKAGAKFHLMKSKSRKYSKTRGVAMNAVSHPFGGEQHHAGKSKSVSRHAPPGRKVGAIGSKRTGRKKK